MQLHPDDHGAPRDGALFPRLAARAALESPALAAKGTSLPAYELKFLISEPLARVLENRLREGLLLDPHADPTLGGAYRIASVYFDTPEFAIYRRLQGHRRHKYRLRRYGAGNAVFLERKSKRAGRVRKRRAALALDAAAGLLAAPAPPMEAAQSRSPSEADFLLRQFAARRLRPVCRIAFDRTAFVGVGEHGPVRVTLDRAARGLPAADCSLEPFVGGFPLLAGEAVVEFKFLSAPPVFFKELIAALKLASRSVSKYRRCVEAAGLAPTDAEREVRHA